MKIPNGKSPYDVKRRLIIPKLNKYRYLWTRCSLHVYPNFHWYLASVIKLLKTALTSLFQNENKGFQNGLQHGIDKIISGPDNNTLGPLKKKIPKPLITQNLTYLPYPPTRPPSLLHYNQTKYSVNFSPFLEIAHCFESCLLTTHTLDDSIRLNRKENSVTKQRRNHTLKQIKI